MTATDAPAVTRPDLAPLLESDPETVAHILCAEFGGATWRTEAGVGWRLDAPPDAVGGRPVMVCLRENDSTPWFLRLPRPLHDDGGAWRLVVRERLDTVAPVGQEYWTAFRVGGGHEAANHACPRRAVVLAALHKHAHDPRWSGLIPSVVERLESTQ